MAGILMGLAFRILTPVPDPEAYYRPRSIKPAIEYLRPELFLVWNGRRAAKKLILNTFSRFEAREEV